MLPRCNNLSYRSPNEVSIAPTLTDLSISGSLCTRERPTARQSLLQTRQVLCNFFVERAAKLLNIWSRFIASRGGRLRSF
jgi:hypothetical protein